MQILANLLKRARLSGKAAANSFGELRPKREVVLNGFKGPESDFGGLGKTPRAHLGPIWPDLAKIWPNKIYFGNPQ